MFARFFIVCLAFALSACATTYKDFKASQVKEDEGVAIGRVTVVYNGQPFTKNCAVCFDSVNGPCERLTEDGTVMQNIKRGSASLRRVVCKDTSLQHYNIANATFVQGDGVTYFGDVKIDWRNSGGFKTTDMFGLIGALISESKNDGRIQMSVGRDNTKTIARLYESQTGLPEVHVEPSLVNPGQ